ncbi:MAG: D-hexose-6-phosphate mutarotase, partial [Pseudomonas sp.]
IYLDVPAQLSILDPLWQRRIHLASSGSRSAVVWNPWIDKAQRLSQFADDAWPGMLCIETANVMDDIVTLAPGAQHSMAVSLWSERT